jgi:UDP-N-acetylmuramyl pentapeptide phosphotransferase/UDP-N-acetylglucosamine-1-phosphate transferase
MKFLFRFFLTILGSVGYTSSIWAAYLWSNKGGYYSLLWYNVAIITVTFIIFFIGWLDDNWKKIKND